MTTPLLIVLGILFVASGWVMLVSLLGRDRGINFYDLDNEETAPPGRLDRYAEKAMGVLQRNCRAAEHRYCVHVVEGSLAWLNLAHAVCNPQRHQDDITASGLMGSVMTEQVGPGIHQA